MTDIKHLKGVGPAVAVKLAKLGIYSVEDLLYHLPRDYHDFSKRTTIDGLRVGRQTVRARISSIKGRYVRRGLHICEAVLEDDTSAVKAVWFNQPYLLKTLRKGHSYVFSGEYSFDRQRYQLMNPMFEELGDKRLNTGKILPIYPETKGISSKRLRGLVDVALAGGSFSPDIPEQIAKDYGLPSLEEAFRYVHQPLDMEQTRIGKRRLAFSELVALTLSGLLAREESHRLATVNIGFHEDETKRFVDSLSYELTPDQRRSSWEIIQDLQANQPMNRLLDGDVGSGKTTVAAIAIKNAVLSDVQVAFIAPTTILAKQHAETLSSVLPEHSIVLLTSSLKPGAKQELKSQVKRGEVDIVVGTHALLQPDVEFNKLGLIIIDEQHRFGVEQRRKLLKRLKFMPHVLSMSATPIPRSLALTIYGELDISLLKTMPKDRKPIETWLVSSSQRRSVDEAIKRHLEAGRQAFVVTPLIEESEMLNATSLETAFERYRAAFSAYKVAMLHGKMTDEQKQALMGKFLDKEIDILISTTVIEVGVDVPNATIMVIESAERFGLAQLHQLRGRVGRAEHASQCILITSTSLRPPKRLQAVVESQNGFELAELDLELRGAGAIYGTRQSGALDLRIADLSDAGLLKSAREAAKQIHDSSVDLIQYPQMAKRIAHFNAITHLN